MTQNTATKKGPRNGKDTSTDALKDRASEALDHSQKAAQEAASQATDEFRKLTKAGSKFVRENPGTAVAGAIGVGILLGLALRGRD